MTMSHNTAWLDAVHFDAQGLIPTIAQDVHTGRILMVAWMNRESLLKTQQTKQAVYFSRSRQKLWHKGEESGHFQDVHEIRLDCDGDVIVLQVTQQGGIACHTGRPSCFYQVLTDDGWKIVDAVQKDPQTIYTADSSAKSMAPSTLTAVSLTHTQDTLTALGALLTARKAASPDSSYVASLFHKGLNKILEKVGEECTETIIAAKDATEQHVRDLVYETADLWFHTLVMLAYFGVEPTVITQELARRFGVSGHAEKAARTPDKS